MDSESLNTLIQTVNNLIVCPGHPDSNLVRMIKAKKCKICSPDGSVATMLSGQVVLLNFCLKELYLTIHIILLMQLGFKTKSTNSYVMKLVKCLFLNQECLFR